MAVSNRIRAGTHTLLIMSIALKWTRRGQARGSEALWQKSTTEVAEITTNVVFRDGV
ncbi:hypothetical protein YTPLAS72_15650 [Nitrospira sp.]|nr:hypothetical protein YTPLAS72_15650 [Nitrospira sp.]